MLSERLADVDARIAQAARSAGRDPAEITRIVVTKFHPIALIEQLAALGVRDVGENRQQELSAKRADPDAPAGLRWHFIGQAQTKKARAIRAAADVVHSLDRDRLADALQRAAEPTSPSETHAERLDVLLQLNLTDDADRGGVSPDQVERLAEHVLAHCPSLRVRGVMAVAPLDEPPAAAFTRVADASRRLRTIVADADWISAGMSGDFVEAITVGATHLRIGTAITGPRPTRD